MDDILITTKGNLTQHQEIIDAILDTLTKESYFLCPFKCVFEQKCIEYLSIIINSNKLSTNPIGANGLKDWPCDLITVKQVWSTLGILGYQHPFIPNYTTGAILTQTDGHGKHVAVVPL